ncbi:MAG TPA: ribbon-helix-helix protein, CopG family [Geobacteraceae bacterium]|nr:ribbon-helix-helix protein, CopG family [Geobacteraceae bacterium]
MLTVRLSEELEHEIDRHAKAERKTRTEVVKEALQNYFALRSGKLTPYQLGEDLFGVGEKGSQDLSTTFKRRLKEKLHEKHSH